MLTIAAHQQSLLRKNSKGKNNPWPSRKSSKYMTNKQKTLFLCRFYFSCKWSVNIGIIKLSSSKLRRKCCGTNRHSRGILKQSESAIFVLTLVHNIVNANFRVLNHLIWSNCCFKQHCLVADIDRVDWYTKLKATRLSNSVETLRVNIWSVATTLVTT